MAKKRLLSLCLAVLALAGCTRHSRGAHGFQANIAAPGEIGSRLPDFQIKDLQGHEISSAQLRGKVVLVDFWAPWCQPCVTEMPAYQKLEDRYGSKGLAVVGLHFDMIMGKENPRGFARKLGLRYPLAIATAALQQKFGGIQGLPTTMLYDRQGILRKKVIGFEDTNAIESAIKSLL